MGPMRDLPNLLNLPTDLFLMITRFLDPIDLVRCRRVSSSWHREFIDESFLREMLVREYGSAQEVRALQQLEVKNILDEPYVDDLNQFRHVWRNAFDRVLARKLAIRSGRPRSVTKLDLRSRLKILEEQAGFPDIRFPVVPWDRYRKAGRDQTASENQWLGSRAPTDLIETEWTYDSGLLVYPDMIEIQSYILLDIERDTMSIVPFDIRDRIVRRVRLKYNLLIFEWAEKEPYHRLNELEDVHRHYVTVFDVESRTDSFPWLTQWKITFRSEWKLHYLGFPLSAQDCWYSDHSTTHYVVYFWQMNRSAWGENEPIESLLIWDISRPSTHRPSNDSSCGSQVPTAPPLVKKLSYLDLDFLTIRQRDTPFLRKIALDGNACVYFFEEGCNREMGLHVGHGYEACRRNPGDVVWERIIGIPVLGHGPRWEDRLGKDSTSGGEWQHGNLGNPDSSMPIRATCWRYAGMGKGIRNQIVRDKLSGIMYFVIQRTIGYPEIWVSDSDSWYTKVHLPVIKWRWNAIDGDERHLIIQGDEELHILHFDDNPRKKMERGRPFLRTAC